MSGAGGWLGGRLRSQLGQALPAPARRTSASAAPPVSASSASLSDLMSRLMVSTYAAGAQRRASAPGPAGAAGGWSGSPGSRKHPCTSRGPLRCASALATNLWAAAVGSHPRRGIGWSTPAAAPPPQQRAVGAAAWTAGCARAALQARWRPHPWLRLREADGMRKKIARARRSRPQGPQTRAAGGPMGSAVPCSWR